MITTGHAHNLLHHVHAYTVWWDRLERWDNMRSGVYVYQAQWQVTLYSSKLFTYISHTQDYYFQCLLGSSSPSSTVATTTVTAITTTKTSTVPTTTKASTTVTGGGTVGPTLLPNYLWIRAVAAPNFHKYLQSYVPSTATDAVLGDASTAGMRH